MKLLYNENGHEKGFDINCDGEHYWVEYMTRSSDHYEVTGVYLDGDMENVKDLSGTLDQKAMDVIDLRVEIEAGEVWRES